MNRFAVKKISFRSYIKLTFLCSTTFPLIIGIFSFIVVLCGGPVAINGSVVPYPTSILYGGLVALLVPVGWGVVFCVFAVFMFLPFRLVMHLLKGVRIFALIEKTDEVVSKNTNQSEELND